MNKRFTLLLAIALAVVILFSALPLSSLALAQGDADGDGEITDWDSIMFDRWLAGWHIAVNSSVLDIDGDGEVTDWDSILLARYLAGWDIEIAPPCNHQFGGVSVAVSPDCVNPGSGTRECRLCGLVETVAIPATGQHDYRTVRSQQASYAHDGYTLKRCAVCGNGKVENITLRTSVAGFYDSRLPINFSGSGYKGIHDWYFYSGENSIGYLQGDNPLSSSEALSWTEAYEALHNVCESRGITVVFLVMPNKEQVYTEYLPSGINLAEDSAKREPLYVEYLKNRNSPIHYIYPLQALKTAKILYETYLQQDTHPNSVGGFVGAMQIYAAIGMPTTGIQNVEITDTSYKGGDLVNLGVGDAKTYTAYNVNYKPGITVRNTAFYSNMVTGNNESPNTELRVFESNAPNTRKAVIIGDSFRHCVAPFIAKDFSKVTSAHRKDFDTVSNWVKLEDGTVNSSGKTVLRDAVRELGEGDLLVVMSVERQDDRNAGIANTLTEFIGSLPGGR